MSDSSIDYLGGNYYISAASLLLEYRSFIDSHPTLFNINVEHPYWPKLVYFCQELEKFPDVMRAITRVHINSQMDFERALFTSWCCLLLARHLKLSESRQRLVFVAGLLQDIGKHTKSDKVLDFGSKLNGPIYNFDANCSYQDNHPLISSSVLKELLPELSGLNDLVLHHHVRHDGTGYPRHIGENQLNIESQLLVVANEVSDQLDYLGGHNQIYKITPMLRLHSMLYFSKAHHAWLKLVEPNLSKKIELNEKGLFEQVVSKVEKLEKMLSSLLIVSAELLPYDFDCSVHGLRSTIHRLACVSTDTGIFDPALLTEKAKSEIQGHDNADQKINECKVVRDIALILKGLPLTLNRMKALVDDILSKNQFDINTSLLRDVSDQLGRNAKSLEGPRCNIFR